MLLDLGLGLEEMVGGSTVSQVDAQVWWEYSCWVCVLPGVLRRALSWNRTACRKGNLGRQFG